MVSFGSRSERENFRNPHQQYAVLVLHNDEVNTFDHVTDALCDVCEHTREQAEQCALITHLCGQCEIKKGERNDLVILSTQLQALALTVTIQ